MKKKLCFDNAVLPEGARVKPGVGGAKPGAKRAAADAADDFGPPIEKKVRKTPAKPRASRAKKAKQETNEPGSGPATIVDEESLRAANAPPNLLLAPMPGGFNHGNAYAVAGVTPSDLIHGNSFPVAAAGNFSGGVAAAGQVDNTIVNASAATKPQRKRANTTRGKKTPAKAAEPMIKPESMIKLDPEHSENEEARANAALFEGIRTEHQGTVQLAPQQQQYDPAFDMLSPSGATIDNNIEYATNMYQPMTAQQVQATAGVRQQRQRTPLPTARGEGRTITPGQATQQQLHDDADEDAMAATVAELTSYANQGHAMVGNPQGFGQVYDYGQGQTHGYNIDQGQQHASTASLRQPTWAGEGYAFHAPNAFTTSQTAPDGNEYFGNEDMTAGHVNAIHGRAPNELNAGAAHEDISSHFNGSFYNGPEEEFGAPDEEFGWSGF